MPDIYLRQRNKSRIVERATFEESENAFRSLRIIRGVIPSLKKLVTADSKSLEETRLMCARENSPKDMFYLSPMTNALSVIWTEKQFLTFMSKRIVVPYENLTSRINYHSEPYNVDCQMIPPRKLNLTGIIEVMDNKQASNDLGRLAIHLAELEENDFNALRNVDRLRGVSC